MPTSLSGDEMLALVEEHSDGEAQRDWKRTLATMTDAPFYEFYPYRIRASGPDAIIASWERLLPLPCFKILDGGEFLGRDEYVGTDSVLHLSDWIFKAPDGTRRRTKVIIRYGFDGDRMESESVFFDAAALPFADAAFDETYRALPGVEVI
jgi:hypothetical protein